MIAIENCRTALLLNSKTAPSGNTLAEAVASSKDTESIAKILGVLRVWVLRFMHFRCILG